MHSTAGEPAALARSPQELVPHGDRDHLVYVVERTDGGQRTVEGTQVEHMSALDQPGAFEVTLSENGIPTGRVQARDDGHTIWLVSEDDLTRQIRLTYDPPLPYLELPLVAGERRAVSTARMSRLADGQPAGALQVTQVQQLGVAPPGRARFGTYQHAVSVRTVRTLQSPEGTLELSTTMVLVPGIGEVLSDGLASGTPPTHRELVCAIIGGRTIGDCRNLNVILKESTDAGSTDLQ